MLMGKSHFSRLLESCREEAFLLAVDTFALGLHLVVTYPCRGLSPLYKAPYPAQIAEGLSTDGRAPLPDNYRVRIVIALIIPLTFQLWDSLLRYPTPAQLT